MGLPKIRRDDGTFQHLNQKKKKKVTNSYMTRVFKGPDKTPFHGSQRDQGKKTTKFELADGYPTL